MREFQIKSISLKSLILIALFYTLSIQSIAQTHVTEPKCEYRINPIGIDIAKPRLSWKISSDNNNVTQKAYEIRFAANPSELNNTKHCLWITGKVESKQSIHIEYNGPELKSMQAVYWKVRIQDNKNKWTKWSEVSKWEMGILNPDLWEASWITLRGKEKTERSLPAQYHRKDFTCSKQVKSARVYVTSLGIYELYLNGKKVGDELFTPGFTSYNKRIQYQCYDIGNMLSRNNAIGAIVGDGWYRGHLGWKGGKNYYGDKLALFLQLHIEYTDGTTDIINSNQNWKSSYGAIRESDIYNGEIYNSQMDHEGCFDFGFDDHSWKHSEVLSHPKDILVASNSIPVKAMQEITPIEIIRTPKGEVVLDLGQNIVGRVKMKVRGAKGDTVVIQYAEVLDKEGNFYSTNLRSAKATDKYILSGMKEEIYEPHFTFHGFRFVKLTNYPGILSTDDITGIVIHSDMQETGSFSCSDSLINQLQSNIQWGQRDNFLDIPTDCPQRDERVGWTGDAQVFSMTAAYNFDVAAFYTKWLKDLALDQFPDGKVPHVIPDMWGSKNGGATGWADAAVIIPWTVYRVYGDMRILKEQYESMTKWVGYMTKHAGDDYLWIEPNHWHWGDWLAYNSDRPDYSGSVTEKDLIATAYFYYSTTLLSKIASILSYKEDAQKYKDLSVNIKKAFAQEYITPNGRLVSHTQTAYALALSFDLIPEKLIPKAANYYAEEIQKFKHLTTGFLGTPLLCSTLSAIERDDLAFMLLNRKEYPSWLYPVTQGATTIWERWDTQKPDGSIIEGMNSFNHYAYGAIGEWLYSHVAGIRIDPETPGYKHFYLDPHPGGGLKHVDASINTMYGIVSSSWKIKDEIFYYEVTIPANTSASVILPKSIIEEVKINSEPISEISLKENKNSITEDVSAQLGSGTYQISYPVSGLKK